MESGRNNRKLLLGALVSGFVVWYCYGLIMMVLFRSWQLLSARGLVELSIRALKTPYAFLKGVSVSGIIYYGIGSFRGGRSSLGYYIFGVFCFWQTVETYFLSTTGLVSNSIVYLNMAILAIIGLNLVLIGRKKRAEEDRDNDDLS
jgi:hypothetical protein